MILPVEKEKWSDGISEPRGAVLADLLAHAYCCPTVEQAETCLRALEQDEYNTYDPVVGARLKHVRSWLEAVKASAQRIGHYQIEGRFTGKELSDALDLVRMTLPNWGFDQALSLAATRLPARDVGTPTPEARLEEILEFFDVGLANRGWRWNGTTWNKQ